MHWCCPLLNGAFFFRSIYTGILDGKSFVIHGPCQSGKTSLLWALEETLKKEPNSVVVYFDMSDISVNCNQKDTEEASVFFGQTLPWNELVGHLQRLPPHFHLYLLADEFQHVFHSSDLDLGTRWDVPGLYPGTTRQDVPGRLVPMPRTCFWMLLWIPI